MKVTYRGYEIDAHRAKSLGGDTLLYYSVFRQVDLYECTSGYSDDADTIQTWIQTLKKRVDEEIADSSDWVLSPKRIQRKRSKGWRMPEDAVYVGRPTKFGNPYRVGRNMPASDCVQFYREWLQGKRYNQNTPNALDVESLRGKDLACWCPLGQPCHADVLLELANG